MRARRYAAVNTARKQAGLKAFSVPDLNRLSAADLDKSIRLSQAKADTNPGLFGT